MNVPKNAQKIVNVATAHGWAVDARHGQSDDRSVASFGVRLSKPDVRAFGVWIDGKWSNGYVDDRRDVLMAADVPCRTGYRGLMALAQGE